MKQKACLQILGGKTWMILHLAAKVLLRTRVKNDARLREAVVNKNRKLKLKLQTFEYTDL